MLATIMIILSQGCGSHQAAANKQEIVTIKVTKAERTEREMSGVLWAEFRFVANDGSKRYRFFANCNQNVSEYHCQFFTPRVGQTYTIELHHEPSVSFGVISEDGSGTGLKEHYYTLESEESISWWNRLTE
jgi:hypothetical protein